MSSAIPLLLVLGATACAGEADAPWTVDESPGEFGGPIDNPFLPMPVGATWSYQATTDEGVEETEVEVLPESREVWGVTATVVRDTVTLDGALAEDTWDWFAQHEEGAVWYFGEDTCEYEGGECVDTGGTWEAGVDGALPGIVMPADPRVGDAWYQEYLPGEAEDQGEVVAVDEAVDVPAGSWTGCVKTRDFTDLEPGSWAHKYYCEGVGLVAEEETSEGASYRVELVSYAGL
jgi:hypothetical protein